MESKNLKLFSLIAAFTAFLLLSTVHAKTVRYELVIENKKVNITGKEVDFSLTVNGGIPAPTLEFTEGDDAEITVHNKLSDEEVSLHWHGILLPPEEDGVAYVNTPPIFPGKSHTFKFRLRQSGTYWYHSHTMVQEQKGVYGGLIIHPKKPTVKADKEAVLVLSDWSDEDADQIIKNLRKDGDYYLYKKNSIRSIVGAAKAGELKTYFKNEWDRMGGMDLSDVGYDAFLINGKKNLQLIEAHPGETIRLRIINAAASSYFYVSLAGLPMKVISADGLDIAPIHTNEILMGMAETYDVLFTVPEHKNYELRATVQDVTGYASAWIGMGEKVHAKDKPLPDLYAPMDHSAHSGHGEHGKVDHPAHGEHANHNDHSNHGTHQNHQTAKTEEYHAHHGHAAHAAAPKVQSADVETLTVDEFKSPAPTTLPKGKVVDLKLVLGGDMERYVWHINGKAIHEDRNIIINENDVVRFTFVNDTMMHHPMHLHGHFFRVLNKHGEYSPLKHTVDVPPMGTRTIEFYANEPGQWMLHCHNLYHMKTGMARVVKYMTYKPSPKMAVWDKQDPHLHDHWYQAGSLQAATNIVEAKYRLTQTWNELTFKAEARKDEEWDGSGDLFYHRWFNNYLNLIVGASAVHHDYRAELGVGYLLPMLLESKLLVDSKGKLRIDLEKRFQWTSTLFTEAEYIWRQDEELGNEYSVNLMYGKNWHWAAGLRYTGESIGVGFQYQF
ncbi:multicopper oxidase domain-containing protein [Bdellovibrio reynosensis]|uniref:Copper-containing nitrite reductase n=1 Tax=Bdellovibrio reynosensis TaxID=2835041 RepID=A0ABY4C962_9BACT|nr:multicopper oxidase domain-containing protein [Bdellovibrio reynosensis]UOF01269.1 multicopper oxidase domain-containing protein [Bdellovibrio reynosensis]